MKRKGSKTIEIIMAIQSYLETHPYANISQIQKLFGINRRTAAKCLRLIVWIHSRPQIFERKGKKGAKIFSVWNLERVLELDWKDIDRMHREYEDKNYFESLALYTLSKILHYVEYLRPRLSGVPQEKIKEIIEGIALMHFFLATKGLRQLSFFKRILVHDIAPAIIYFVCKDYKIPVTLEEIERVSGVPQEKIKELYDFLKLTFYYDLKIVPLIAAEIKKQKKITVYRVINPLKKEIEEKSFSFSDSLSTCYHSKKD